MDDIVTSRDLDNCCLRSFRFVFVFSIEKEKHQEDEKANPENQPEKFMFNLSMAKC